MADAPLAGQLTSHAAERADEQPLYVPRKKIYPQAVKGRFRTIKWIVLAVTLGIYYFLPFIRWDRGPHAPNQAILVDLPNHRFYFFFIEIWPQEVYYITGLLILAALTLFLMNAVAGRVWCGYLCPQTVWTDLFYAVERLIEGDRRERTKRAKEKAILEIVTLRILKHSIWLLIAWWTGGAWVLYFADAPTLVGQLLTFQAPAIAYIWIGILTFTTYTLAGFMREQVCTYMCPWPRIQAALTDEYALNVTYRYDRGEPRGSMKKNEALKKQGLPAGDCIDCDQCVAVCPTGVDIRKGLQLDCIQCGLCIDACNTVMAKIGRAPNLIAYDTDMNVQARIEGRPETRRIVRPRTILYAGLIVTVGAIMLVSLAMRHTTDLSVMHDRNPLFVRLSDGSIRNGFTIRVANKNLEERRYALEVEGLPDARLDVVGGQVDQAGRAVIVVGPDQTLEARALVTAGGKPPSSTGLRFTLTDTASGETAHAGDHFMAP
ncbi:cytochrome c oxidase accessory protein CcoG [Microvirga thermotolerans]|uniref:Cytochrome c oxidase accessory protein CcoG n=1 Tax=Microvirga thermotolerans TaxID=2651334 RepID=A0A5P9JXG9_9HYPH|nr:cytochrome c oxidase accessory protein CcoG [Microvirga thermotolerans]QFU16110.1 cytochrome c oxidase accessory protein CcoG [Microvirga thermotolerans]